MRYVPSFHLLAFLRATTEHQLIGSRGSTPSQPRGRGRGRRRERDIWSGVNPGYSDGEGYLSSQVEDRSTVLQERHTDLTFSLVVFFSGPRVGIFRCIHSFRFCLYIFGDGHLPWAHEQLDFQNCSHESEACFKQTMIVSRDSESTSLFTKSSICQKCYCMWILTRFFKAQVPFVGPDYHRLIDFSMNSFPLLSALRWSHRYVRQCSHPPWLSDLLLILLLRDRSLTILARKINSLSRWFRCFPSLLTRAG